MDLKCIRLNIVTSFFCLLFAFNCSSQNSSVTSSLSLIGKNINKAFEVEKQLKSIPVKYQSNIYIGSDFLPKADTVNISPNPLIFIGRDKSFAPNKQVQITYYFDEIDSLIQLITFEWQPNTTGTPRNGLISHHNHYESYEKTYTTLFDDFKVKLGAPDKFEEITEQQGVYLGRSIWKHAQFTIELHLIFSTEQQEGTQLVRVKMH
ncbi:MAG: hypothetical protein KI790_05725 [Cyclobacteriaceae bacterium]|nr:hypothetical protein [Cyclobacteriaceae bacterium HetDA_MAG_MS6]